VLISMKWEAQAPRPNRLLAMQSDGNVVKFRKLRKPQAPPSAAATSDGPRPRKPIPALLIFAVMVALIAAYGFLKY